MLNTQKIVIIQGEGSYDVSMEPDHNTFYKMMFEGASLSGLKE